MRRNRNGLFLIAVLTLLCVPVAAWATPVTWSENGHSYELIIETGGIAWEDAEAAAEAAGGYLATITSSEENLFVWSLVNEDVAPDAWYIDNWGSHIGPWLGGYKDALTSAWSWTTGETWSFTAWASGEPNNSGGSENRVHYFSNGTYYWNDIGENTLLHSYVIEYDSAAVPIPGAFWLLGSGLVGLVRFRKRLFA